LVDTELQHGHSSALSAFVHSVSEKEERNQNHIDAIWQLLNDQMQTCQL